MPSGNTTTYEWWLVSKTYQTAPLGQPQEVTETLIMRRRDLANLDFGAEYANMIAEGALPQPDHDYGASTGTFLDNLRARSVSGEKQDSIHARVTIRWSSLYADSGPGATGLWLPASTDYSTRLRPMQAWRRNWTASPGDYNESAEIGGDNIVTAGEPVTQEVPQLAFRVRQTFDASVTGMLAAVAPNVDIVGKLNSDTFYGFVAGTVLCEGISATKIDGMTEHYEVVVDFLYDKFFHLSQVPDCDNDGRIVFTDTIPPGKGPKTVKWKRISRATAAFNSVFASTDYKTLAQTGWWP
jgi:hypothetical protein